MSVLLQLCLLLTAFSTLVSSGPTPPSVGPAGCDNCSGGKHVHIPNDPASYRPQIGNSPGWEEWTLVSQDSLPDGSPITYNFKWSVGDPTLVNASQQVFTAWTYFPNGTLYAQFALDTLKYVENPDGGFTYSIDDNHLTWDAVNELWSTSINAGGWVVEADTKNVAPDVPFVPNYNSVPAQVTDGYFSRVDVPRGYTEGYMAFPWGLNLTLGSVGIVKHTWSHKAMNETLTAYVRGSVFTPSDPLGTINWFQAWDPSGKEIDSVQFLFADDDTPDSQAFKFQITEVPELLKIVTTPTPSNPPVYNGTQLTTPLCEPGVDFKTTGQKVTWDVVYIDTALNFVDPSNGTISYYDVSFTADVWFDGAPKEISGTGIVEMYRR